MALTDKNPKTTWDSQAIPRLLPQVLQHRWFIIGMTVTGLAVAGLAVLAVRPRYEVSSTLMLRLGDELAAPATVDDSRFMPAAKRSEDLATEIEIMSSQQIVAELVASFGEDFFYAQRPAVTLTQKAKRLISGSIDSAQELLDNTAVTLGMRRKLSRLEKVVLALQTGLNIEPARKSDVTRISLQISDPAAGEQILSKFIELYLVKHVDVFRVGKAKPFFELETGNLLAQIRKLQGERIELKKTSNTFSAEIERKLLLDLAETARSAKSELIGEAARINAEIELSVKRLASLPRELQVSNIQQRNPVLSMFESKLATLEADRVATQLRYNTGSRTIVDLDQQIEAFKPKLTDTPPLVVQSVTTSLNSAAQDMEREIAGKRIILAGMTARMAELDRNLAETEERLRNMEVTETRLRDLERELLQQETTYAMYRKSAEQARMADAMYGAQIANVAVIDPPKASLRPVWPSYKIWLAAGGLTGAFLSAGIVLLRDIVRPVARTADDVRQATQWDVLASLPGNDTSTGRNVRATAAGVDPPYRQLAFDVQKLSNGRPGIFVTSDTDNDGTAQVAARLAEALAEVAGSDVLFIDAGISPSNRRLPFDIRVRRTLNGWSGNEALPVQATNIPRLSVLLAGTESGPADLSEKDRLQKLCSVAELAAAQFETVVWSAPGVLNHPGVKQLAAAAGSMLLVVDAHQTKLSDLQEVREQLTRSGTRPIGAVLRGVDRYTFRMLR